MHKGGASADIYEPNSFYIYILSGKHTHFTNLLALAVDRCQNARTHILHSTTITAGRLQGTYPLNRLCHDSSLITIIDFVSFLRTKNPFGNAVA